MNTWKTKKKAHKTISYRPWKAKIISVVFLLITLVAFVFDFPHFYNQGAAFVKDKTQFALPTLNENVFRLGLDLQGGTHLVYEADMKDVPAADHDSALAGVRDVIERRVNAFGVSEPIVQTTNTGGKSRVIIELAGVLNVSDAIAQIGETPVLEFKEQGDQLDREPTQADKDELAKRQKAERNEAAAVLKRAVAREDFEKLVLEVSDENDKENTKGLVENVMEDGAYPEIAKEITKNFLKPGQVLWKTVEASTNELNVFKLLEKSTKEQMQLSHILICYEGKTGCATTISAIDAMTQITKLKNEANAINFAALAKANSSDPSAQTNSGDLGFALASNYVAPFAVAATSLAVGKISDVIETDFGYHLIYKKAVKSVPSFKIQRIAINMSNMTDVVPQSSPWKNSELSGKHLSRADVEFDPNSGNPFIGLTFNTEGGELFGKITAANIGKPIAIFLDGQPISTPVVQQAIYGGRAVITGTFTLPEAKTLAQRLNAGALPVPVTLLSQQTIGPTLGFASLQKSILAALIGFALVALYMILVYRFPGFIAVVALLLFVFVNLAMYQIFGVTITLAGIAGLVLSLGIAVDANVLTIERLKEEYASGRDLHSSIDEASHRAWAAIRDGHMTTLISALVLYFFSSSFIRGFALTLAIGVVLSLFTAVYVSNTYLKSTLGWKWLHKPALFGVKIKKH